MTSIRRTRGGAVDTEGYIRQAHRLRGRVLRQLWAQWRINGFQLILAVLDHFNRVIVTGARVNRIPAQTEAGAPNQSRKHEHVSNQ